MPFEGNGVNPFQVHDCNRGSEQESEQGKNPKVHDQGFSEDQEIGNILEHDSCLDRNSSLHSGVDHAGIIVGARPVEPLARGLACTKEEG